MNWTRLAFKYKIYCNIKTLYKEYFVDRLWIINTYLFVLNLKTVFHQTQLIPANHFVSITKICSSLDIVKKSFGVLKHLVPYAGQSMNFPFLNSA